MKIAVGILTHNVMSSLRSDLLERTLASVATAFPSAHVLLLDNNSHDGSAEHIQSLHREGRSTVHYHAGNGKPGTGRLAMMELLSPKPDHYDLIVFSDDDMEWKVGAEAKLVDLWSAAPPDLTIVGGLLEADWPWNTPRETLTLSQTNVLVRDSCPGAAWTFRGGDWSAIKPHIVKDFGYDSKACAALRREGRRVAQLDLADHIGWGASTHGNEAVDDIRAKPLDRAKWRV